MKPRNTPIDSQSQFRIRRRVPFICYYYRTFRIFIRIEDSMGFLTNLFHCNHCATLLLKYFFLLSIFNRIPNRRV